MINVVLLYYNSEFYLNTEDAATMGFIYGSMHIFAKGLGGYISDKLNLQLGMRGRLLKMKITVMMPNKIHKKKWGSNTGPQLKGEDLLERLWGLLACTLFA
jgi:nitrate/nitrite transporter NarK